MIEKLTTRQKVLLVSPQLPTDEHINAGATALRIIEAQARALTAAHALLRDAPYAPGTRGQAWERLRDCHLADSAFISE